MKLNYSWPGSFKKFSSGKSGEILEHCAKLICFSGAYTTKNCKAFSSDYNNLDFEAVDEDRSSSRPARRLSVASQTTFGYLRLHQTELLSNWHTGITKKQQHFNSNTIPK